MPFQIPAVGLKLRNMGTRSASQTLCIALHALRARATDYGIFERNEIHCILINIVTLYFRSQVCDTRKCSERKCWTENARESYQVHFSIFLAGPWSFRLE